MYDSLINDVQEVLADGLGLAEEALGEVVIYSEAFPAILVADMKSAVDTLQRIESALYQAVDGGGEISYTRNPFG